LANTEGRGKREEGRRLSEGERNHPSSSFLLPTNFIIKGEIEIVKTNFITGEVTTITQENLIPDNTLLELLSWDVPNNYFGSKKISISSQTDSPSYGNATVADIIATGYVPSSITSPIWIESVEPPYGIIKNRIDFIGLARTFYTVALTTLSSNNDAPNETTTASAYLLLTLPCTQGEFEYLDIQYRIQFLSSGGQKFINEKLARYDFGRECFNPSPSDNLGFRISWLYASLFTPPQSIYAILSPSGKRVARSPSANIEEQPFWTSGIRIDSHYKWKYLLALTRDESIGQIFNLMSQGVSNDGFSAYAYSKFSYVGEPFQTGFWHSEAANKPFFDPTFAAASGGKIYLGGTWNGSFPELYKVIIAGSGATGVATYKFSMLKHLGFIGNSFNSQDTSCPFIQTALQPAENVHGWREENFDKHRYSNTQIVQYDDNGVTLLNTFNGDRTNWETSTTPPLNATQIRQIAVDSTNNKIYVGCRQTGLWTINVTANTVTLTVPTPCYGVDVGRNDVAIALLQGGLFTSSNWAVPVTFTYSGITDGNWNKVQFLKADSENVNDNIAIVIEDGSANKVVWYDFTSTTATTGYAGDIPKYCAALDCSDSGGVWFFANTNDANLSRIHFGDNSVEINRYNGLGKTFIHSLYSYSYYQKVCFYQKLIYTFNALQDADDSGNDIDYPNIANTIYAIYLDTGITLFGKVLRQAFNDSAFKWLDYGWNGTNWVKDNPGSKTTHITADTILNGLTIRFQDGDTAQQFVITDEFTQGVNYGLLKDNATSIDSYISQWYTREVIFDAVSSATIPSAAPYTLTLSAASLPLFLRIETDTPQLHEFKIMSILVAAVYVNGEPPAPNEVAINSNGIVTFNAADAGKTFNAKYTYIKI
jgi:hypothetical protein